MLGTINRFNLTILVDLNYLGIRSSYRFQDFSMETPRGRVLTGSLFGVLQFLEAVSTNYPFAKIIICNDGAPSERKKLFEGYKASRVATPDKPLSPEISSWRNLKQELFRMIGGIPNLVALYHPDKEADDLIARLAYMNRDAGRDVVIFTSDKDMMQLMSIGANISKEIHDGEFVLLQEDYVLNHDKLGVLPEYIPYLRPFAGDPSDDIPAAVSRVPKAVRAAVAKGWFESGRELTEDSMNYILDSITDLNITKITRQKFIEGIPQANLNFKLMDLTRYKDETIDGVRIIPLEFNPDVILFYGLKKYLNWREGKSISFINANNLI